MRSRYLNNAVIFSLGLIALAGPSEVTAQAQQQPIIIEGGTLIDGRGGPPLQNAAIVIEGNRITQVGVAGEVQRPARARVINAEGKFIAPGLIDAKSNYTSVYGESYLIWGVTTIILSGGSGDAATAERDAINAGIFPGPRIFHSFAAIAGAGPQGNRQDGGIPGRYPYVARNAAEARRIARDFISAGADFLSAADGDGEPEVFEAVVEEADRAGLVTVMRTVGPRTYAQQCAEIGCDVLIHTGNVGNQISRDPERWTGYNGLPPDPYSDMDDVKAQAMAEYLVSKNVALEPDIIATGRGFPRNWARLQEENANFFSDPALLAYLPPKMIRGIVENAESPENYLRDGSGFSEDELGIRRDGFLNHMRFLKMFVDAGGKILPASDVPQSPPGLGVHQEMAVFQEDVGLTPMQVLQSATQWNAEAFGLDNLGTIEAGNFADIIIVNADPTADILNLRQIDTVVKDGRVVDRRYHADYLDRTFKVGQYVNGDCCFSTPVIENVQWMNALKAATYRPNVENGGWRGVGAFDSPNSATPGIESFYPYTIMQNSPRTLMTIRGFNFVQGSEVLIDGEEVEARPVSATEIEVVLDEQLLARAGRFTVYVRNPEPIATPEWGNMSNPARLLIPYEGVTTRTSQNRF